MDADDLFALALRVRRMERAALRPARGHQHSLRLTAQRSLSITSRLSRGEDQLRR